MARPNAFTIFSALMFAAIVGLPSDRVALAAETIKIGPPVKPADEGLMAPVWAPGHPPKAGQKLSFRSLPLKLGVTKIQLSGGTVVVDLLDWRAVAVSDISDGEMCSLTLVGPRTVLLAAHCVDAHLAPGEDGEPALTAEVRFVATGNPYKMNCDLSEDYLRWRVNDSGVPRSAADYALCELDRRVEDIKYEMIALDTDLKIAEVVTLVGHGCDSLGLSNDETHYTYKDGHRVLRIGERPIEATTVSLNVGRPALYWRTLSESGREPALCYGDSGGPVMFPKQGGARRVIAVNSALGATPTATHLQPAFYSYLSPLSTKEFRSFVKRWTAKGEGKNPAHPRVICGFNLQSGNQGCRI
ncbi:trypsin-like serine peptidase [Pseudomonas sp. PDM09]|uniref:trypsin-like serine peptidase n=1 Tax=Pseudomonas sp. PDM09 TaxID=2769270 RepID=UPI00177C7965|nr:trypsin-like serine protease [Pseudomonas sp. PDM09]MBD9565272.1 trypsin-like serine protease [Pseudomonas sp. PDM09]